MGHLTSRDAYRNLEDRINWFTQGAAPSETLTKILKLLFTENWKNHDIGLIDEQELYEETIKVLPEHLHRIAEEIIWHWHDRLDPIEGSADLVKEMKEKGFHLYLLSCLQVLGLMSIAYCIYRALGLNQYTYWDVLTLQFLLFIAASFTPLPGASGAQEGGFYIFFQHVFPADKLVGALLLWRFFTYYFTMIIGVGAVIFDSAWSMRQGAGKNAADAGNVTPEAGVTDAARMMHETEEAK